MAPDEMLRDQSYPSNSCQDTPNPTCKPRAQPVRITKVVRIPHLETINVCIKPHFHLNRPLFHPSSHATSIATEAFQIMLIKVMKVTA